MRWHRSEYRGIASHIGALTNLDMITYADTPTQTRSVAYHYTPGNTAEGCYDDVSASLAIVADMNMIVERAALANHRVVHHAPVDTHK